MKKRFLSVALALCLCISSQSVVYAGQEAPSLQENALLEASAPESRDSTILTPSEVYQSMIALKEQEAYKEGTAWDDDTPYPSSNPYRWKGGTLDGKNILAQGCVAFAFILSDAAFGNLPARMYDSKSFKYEDIKPGDILRMNTDIHTVIVLEAHDTSVIIAEGNLHTGDDKQGRIHWGRTISKDEVMRDTSHYITRYPEGYISPDDPTANEELGSGTLSVGLTWKLVKSGTLTISGKGAMPDYSGASEQPWSKYSGQIRKVVIEDGVTNIGDCAFMSCGLLSAEIPSSVATIGNSAFRESKIVSVTIPSSVKTIGDSAFRECKGLSSVTVSDGLETIVQNAFLACTSLTAISLPASIGEVGAGAFFQCTAMTEATFAPGSKQVKLGDNLFTQCYYLMKVTLPKSIDRIGDGMFQNCTMFPGVEIPQGAESIGTFAFASSNTSVVLIPDSVTSIGSAAFSDCPLKDIYFTGTEAQWKSISKMGDTAAAVSKATIHYDYVPGTTPGGDDNNNPGGDDNNNPGGDDNNNPGGDNNNPGGDNNNPGGDNSNPGGDNNNPGGDNNNPGGDNNNPDGDNNNPGGDNNNPGGDNNNPGDDNNNPGGDNSNPGGSNTPGGDSSNPGGSNTPGGDDSNKPGDDNNTPGGDDSNTPGGDDNNKPGDDNNTPAPKPLPKGESFKDTNSTYKVTKTGKEVTLTASKSISTKKNVTVNTVTGSDGVKYKVTAIAPKAMQNNKKVTSLVIGPNVKTIGANAFSGCTKLKTVSLGKNVTTIGDNAFKGCTSLKNTLILPNQVKTVGNNAFSGCNKITTVTIGKTSKSNLTTIKAGAFKGCKNLRRVIIKSTKLKSISKQAFKGTSSSLKVKVPAKQYAKYKKLLMKAGLKSRQITK